MTSRRGRPPGPTAQGLATRQRLYEAALQLFAEQGYAQTSLREVALAADVSPALLYRYFDSKQAVLAEFYDERALRLEAQVAELPQGSWAERALALTRQSLEVLRPHRRLIQALLPLLLSDGPDGLLGARSAPSRERVSSCFVRAVAGAADRPDSPERLGRLLYLMHLLAILGWSLDRSPGQRASEGLLLLAGGLLPLAAGLLWLPGSGALLQQLDELCQDAFLHPAEVPASAPPSEEGGSP